MVKKDIGRGEVSLRKSQDKEADPGIMNINPVGVDKPTRKTSQGKVKIPRFFLSVVVLYSAVQGANGQGFTLVNTKQTLPDKCLSSLTLNGCPQKGVFEFWQESNQICCADYPGVFQCQEIPGGTLIFAACLPEQTVPPGKIGQLINNETGFVELDLTTDCDHGTYRSERINSSFIRYPRCEEKTRQLSEEEKVCYGGITAGDLFVCKEGYQSHCSQGRNSSHDFCECIKLNCTEGSQPFRNMTGSCIAGNFRVTYGCRFGSGENGTEIPPGLTDATTTTTTTNTTTNTTNTTTTTTNTTTTPNTEQGGNSGIAIWIVISVIGAVLLVIAIYCLRRYCNKHKGSYNCTYEKAHQNTFWKIKKVSTEESVQKV